MRELGFSLTRIVPNKDRTVDSVLTWEKRVSENLYSCQFYAVQGPKLTDDIGN